MQILDGCARASRSILWVRLCPGLAIESMVLPVNHRRIRGASLTDSHLKRDSFPAPTAFFSRKRQSSGGFTSAILFGVRLARAGDFRGGPSEAMDAFPRIGSIVPAERKGENPWNRWHSSVPVRGPERWAVSRNLILERRWWTH